MARSDQSFLDEISGIIPGNRSRSFIKGVVAIQIVFGLIGLAIGGTVFGLVIMALWKYIHST